MDIVVDLWTPNGEMQPLTPGQLHDPVKVLSGRKRATTYPRLLG